MDKPSMICAGIDTSKMTLDIALHPTGQAMQVANDGKGHGELIAWLKRCGVARIGIEASGGYERDVVKRLRAAGFVVVVLQPRQVRAFAIWRLKRAKTDALDARLIAACVAEMEVVERAPPDPRLAALAEHLRLIEQLGEDLVRAKTRLEACRERRTRQVQQREIARLENRIAAETQFLLALIRAHADLEQRLVLIESVRGVGQRTALTLLVLMPELGRLSREQAAALAGLAPFDHESGQKVGEKRIAGGRGRVRRALYAAALPAAFRWNPALVDLYKRHVANGMPHKKALTACARKLLVYVNAVLARGTPWLPAAA